MIIKQFCKGASSGCCSSELAAPSQLESIVVNSFKEAQLESVMASDVKQNKIPTQKKSKITLKQP